MCRRKARQTRSRSRRTGLVRGAGSLPARSVCGADDSRTYVRVRRRLRDRPPRTGRRAQMGAALMGVTSDQPEQAKAGLADAFRPTHPMIAMTPPHKRKNAGHEARRQFCRQKPTSPSRGELAAAKARDLGGCNDPSPTAHPHYVGRRAPSQRKAPHDSHVTPAFMQNLREVDSQ